MYQKLFLNKVAFLRPAALLKKRPWHRCFSVSFMKFLRTLFFTRLPLDSNPEPLSSETNTQPLNPKTLSLYRIPLGANSNLCRLRKKALLIKKKRVTLGKLCFKSCYMKQDAKFRKLLSKNKKKTAVWSHLLRKSVLKNFIFRSVLVVLYCDCSQSRVLFQQMQYSI